MEKIDSRSNNVDELRLLRSASPLIPGSEKEKSMEVNSGSSLGVSSNTPSSSSQKQAEEAYVTPTFLNAETISKFGGSRSSPLDRAWLLSKIFFWWMNGLFWAAWKQKLSEVHKNFSFLFSFELALCKHAHYQ